jgi:hypothetical protein
MASSFFVEKKSSRHKEPLERRIPNPFPQSTLSIQKGDMLWTVLKKTGTPLNVLINSNLGVVEGRVIRQDDKIAVR